MTFGYIGYIWAMLGCAIFAIVVGSCALVLYAIGRRARGGTSGPSHSVQSLPVRVREPGTPPPADAA